jgi:HECT-domain (ubiquitin-transferase)
VSFEDLKDLDSDMARGLQQLLDFEGDVEEVFGRTFSVAYQRFGEMCEFELKPNGAKIPLTQENKQEYVKLYTDYLLNLSIERQFKYFEQGFHMVCNTPGMNMLFRPEELEQLIVGSEELDFAQLEKITKYQGFSVDDAIIRCVRF